MSDLLPDLKIGITSAIFKDSGKTPFKIQWLNILVITGAIMFTLNLINCIFGISERLLLYYSYYLYSFLYLLL